MQLYLFLEKLFGKLSWPYNDLLITLVDISFILIYF